MPIHRVSERRVSSALIWRAASHGGVPADAPALLPCSSYVLKQKPNMQPPTSIGMPRARSNELSGIRQMVKLAEPDTELHFH
ncbi:hypothetical protein TREES_T100020306 [Tupaia chinensis]|uniref:Uncharacterized protein n=1 Tax=Tupaia chinensis TaxID=246437 RepID=L9L5C1_TUPCH|nr:hypothetical protein TREES_T100020306 [Tupaia chinensis]